MDKQFLPTSIRKLPSPLKVTQLQKPCSRPLLLIASPTGQGPGKRRKDEGHQLNQAVAIATLRGDTHRQMILTKEVDS